MDMPTKLSNIADDILEQGMQPVLEDKQAMVKQLTPTGLAKSGTANIPLCRSHRQLTGESMQPCIKLQRWLAA